MPRKRVMRRRKKRGREYKAKITSDKKHINFSYTVNIFIFSGQHTGLSVLFRNVRSFVFLVLKGAAG
jgi:hypothetical protein